MLDIPEENLEKPFLLINPSAFAPADAKALAGKEATVDKGEWNQILTLKFFIFRYSVFSIQYSVYCIPYTAFEGGENTS